MEAFQFWHLLGEVCFQTLVADVLRLCQTAFLVSRSSVWTRDITVQLWGLWLMRQSCRIPTTSSAPCFVLADGRMPGHPVVTENCVNRAFNIRLCSEWHMKLG